MLSFLVLADVFVWHVELTYFLHSWVVWAYGCHLLPSKEHINSLSLQGLHDIGEVVFNPFIFKVYLMMLSSFSLNSLIPNCNLVDLAFLCFEFADDACKDNVSVPVDKSLDISLKVKLECCHFFIIILVVHKVSHLCHFELSVIDCVWPIEAMQEVEGTHQNHSDHHVVANDVQSTR